MISCICIFETNKLRTFSFINYSLFSMDGDFAPFPELVKLRRKYGFLLVIDDVSILSPLKYNFTDLGANRILFIFYFLKAHGTLVCGENGGGAAELFDCENDIDISVGTLSKAAGCQGGFIACR